MCPFLTRDTPGEYQFSLQSDSTLDLLARSSTVCVLKLIDTTAGVRQRARVSRSRARISMGSEISLSHGAGSVKIRAESAADGARQSPRDENSAPVEMRARERDTRARCLTPAVVSISFRT